MSDDGSKTGRRHVAQLTIRGRALDRSFLAFASHRAQRFSLNGWAALRGDELFVVVEGPDALIDMMEVACMLGPIEALVDHIERSDQVIAPPGATGFRLIG